MFVFYLVNKASCQNSGLISTSKLKKKSAEIHKYIITTCDANAMSMSEKQTYVGVICFTEVTLAWMSHTLTALSLQAVTRTLFPIDRLIRIGRCLKKNPKDMTNTTTLDISPISLKHYYLLLFMLRLN